MEGIGIHCTMDLCHQKDFLPFTCPDCMKEFCSEHRSATSHDCKETGYDSVVLLICPLCNDKLKVREADDQDTMLTAHMNTAECKPHLKEERQAKVEKCPAKGCKKKMTTINSTKCTKCFKKVCFSHRYSDQHIC